MADMKKMRAPLKRIPLDNLRSRALIRVSSGQSLEVTIPRLLVRFLGLAAGDVLVMEPGWGPEDTDMPSHLIVHKEPMPGLTPTDIAEGEYDEDGNRVPGTGR